MFKSDPFYRTQRWLKLSKAVRAKYPICQLCNLQMSKAVDHVNGDIRNNYMDNLWALCISCHSWKTSTGLLDRESVTALYRQEMGED